MKIKFLGAFFLIFMAWEITIKESSYDVVSILFVPIIIYHS